MLRYASLLYSLWKIETGEEIIEIFKAKPYFLSDEFSLVDCSIAPLLWRLPSLNIQLPREAKAIVEYGNRVFDRPSFRSSLSEEELDSWQSAVENHGESALKTTTLQKYRQP